MLKLEKLVITIANPEGSPQAKRVIRFYTFACLNQNSTGLKWSKHCFRKMAEALVYQRFSLRRKKTADPVKGRRGCLNCEGRRASVRTVAIIQ
jgi:hypothetical protein